MRIQIDQSSAEQYSMADCSNNFIAAGIGYTADFCLRSKIFSLITLGHLHTFIHELGHAIMYEVLSGGKATIHLSTKSCYGSTSMEDPKRSLSPVSETIVSVAGPLADVLFSVILIVGIFALTHFISMPVGLCWGLRAAVAIPAMAWIGGEALYGIISSCNVDNGDFGKIASKGWTHLLICLALIVTILALCALGVAFLV